MGHWGTGFYEDDCTLDVQEFRDVIPDLQRQGFDAREISKAMQKFFSEPLQDEKEGPLVLAAIADQLRNYDALPKDLLNAVLIWLDAGGDIADWKQNAPESAAARAKALRQLRNRLISPSRQKKETTARQRIFWHPEQLYALPLLSQEAAKLGLQEEYLLIYILTEGELVNGYQAPESWVKVTKNGRLPRSVAEFDSLDFIPLYFSKEEVVLKQPTTELLLSGEKIIPLYNMFLTEARGSHPPKNLLYLGSYHDIAPPTPDYRLHKHCLGATWKYLEEYFLKMYWLFYLRHAKWL